MKKMLATCLVTFVMFSRSDIYVHVKEYARHNNTIEGQYVSYIHS